MGQYGIGGEEAIENEVTMNSLRITHSATVATTTLNEEKLNYYDDILASSK